jgi:rhamnosyltransferase subunit B
MAKRILFTTFGSLGDLHPYIAIALELRRRGYEVAIATSLHLREHIENAGLRFLHVRPDLSETDRAIVRRFLAPTHGPRHLLKFLFSSVRESFEDLSQVVKQADLLVTHPATFAGPPVAKVTAIPWVSTVLSPLSFLSMSDPPVMPQMPSLDLRRMPRLLSRSIIALGKRSVYRWSKPLRRFYREIGLPLDFDPVFEGQHSPHRVLALFSSILARAQLDWPPNTTITGFAFYDGNAPSSPALEAFISAGEAPIVFTLGSAAWLSAGDFYKSSAAAVEMLGKRAILLGGPDLQDSISLSSSNIFAAGYVPYSKILPLAKAVVHSGGIGTTGQALRAGHPMVVVPFSHDQPDNAARLRSLGLCETIQIRKYDAHEAARALTKILSDRRYADNAHRASCTLKSEDGVKNACEAIVHVIEGRSPSLSTEFLSSD